LQALNGDDGQQTTDHRQSSAVNNQSQPQQEQGITLPQLLELAEPRQRMIKNWAGSCSMPFSKWRVLMIPP
jgi:hypothetical protein